MKVKGNGELDGIQGTELTTQPVFADEFPGHFEVGVEHSQGANQAAVGCRSAGVAEDADNRGARSCRF